MISKESPRVDEIILSKGEKAYRFQFQMVNKDEMLIKAEEKKEKDEIIPHTYQKLLAINDLSKRASKVVTDMRVVLNLIKSCCISNKLDFVLEGKNIKLCFYYFGNKEKEEIIIPSAKTDGPEIIHALSSKLSQSQKSFEKAFNKKKALQSNINSAKASTTKPKNKENYVKSIDKETALNKKHSEDNFNQIKVQKLSILSKSDAQTSSLKQEDKTKTNQTVKSNSNLNTKVPPSNYVKKNKKAVNKPSSLGGKKYSLIYQQKKQKEQKGFKKQNEPIKQVTEEKPKIITEPPGKTDETNNPNKGFTQPQTEWVYTGYGKSLTLSNKYKATLKELSLLYFKKLFAIKFSIVFSHL